MSTLIEEYIRAAATARGINPDIAVRVAKSEGGLNDPTRRAGYVKNGFQEPSYGPYQLLIGGDGTGFPEGLGNRAVAAGIDPRDPNQWQKGVDFALDEVKRDGWRQWYGAGRAGIDRWDGVNGAAPRAQPDPYAAMPDGKKGEEQYAFPGPSQSRPPLPEMAGGPDVPALTGEYVFGKEKPTIWDRLAGIAQIADAFAPPEAPRVGGSLNPGDNRLLTAALDGPSVAQQFIKKRLGFLG